MRTERGFERLITFADAVVAIALTLLVLPLSEIASELSKDTSVGAYPLFLLLAADNVIDRARLRRWRRRQPG